MYKFCLLLDVETFLFSKALANVPVDYEVYRILF